MKVILALIEIYEWEHLNVQNISLYAIEKPFLLIFGPKFYLNKTQRF